MKQPTLLLALFLVACCLAQTWHTADVALGMDFYQFWAVGQALRTTPVQNIYSAEGRAFVGAELARRAQTDPLGKRHRAVARFRPVLETYSTPFLYAALSLFSSSHYEIAYQCYQVFCLLCALLAVLVFCRLLGYSWTAALLAAAALIGFFEPLLSDVRMGNVNQIQLALVALFCWLASRGDAARRDFLAGLTLGALVLFKPNMLFVGVLWTWWWLVTKQFKRLAIGGAGVAAALALALASSAALFGSLRCWSDWAVALLSMPDNIIPVDPGNFALAMLAHDAWGVNLGAWLMALFGAPALIVLWLRREDAREDDALMAVYVVGLGGLIYLLSARLVWLHYYTAAIPLLLAGLRGDERRAVWATRGLTVAALVMLCVTPLFGVTDSYAAGWFVSGGALVLAVATLAALGGKTRGA